MAFALVGSSNGTVRIEYKGTTSYTAEALLAAPVDPEECSALDEAKDFLREALKNGPCQSKTLKEEAHEAGVSQATLKRAKKALSVRAVKGGDDGSWLWTFAQKAGQGKKEAQSEHPPSQALKNEPLERLEPLPAGRRISEEQEGQGAQDAQGVQGAQQIVGSCIHDVVGGCWICKKKAREDGETLIRDHQS